MAQLILRLDDGEEVVLNEHVRDEVIASVAEIPLLERVFGDIERHPANGFWTGLDGRSNSSPLVKELNGVVYDLLSGGCGSILSRSWRGATANLIVAQLAHIHGMAPLMPKRREKVRP